MSDEKEGRKKQARSNKQQGKATQHECVIVTSPTRVFIWMIVYMICIIVDFI